MSLPGEDVQLLDEYAKEQGLESRSAAVQQAVRLLRTAELPPACEGAWNSWATDGDGEAWQATDRDGLSDVSPA